MNLVELTHLINNPSVQADAQLLVFYEAKRMELVAEINAEFASIGLPTMTLRELLLASPEPRLASTVSGGAA